MIKRQYKRKKGKSISKAKKYTFRGIEYKSGLELYAAQRFTEEQIFFQYEPVKFVLQDSFYMIEELYERQANGKGDFKKRGGKKVLPLTYQPDFVNDVFICETKGWAGEAFPLRWKLFKKMIADNYEGDIMIFKPQSKKDVDDMISTILTKEIWKDFHNYSVSNYGRVMTKSKKTNITRNREGYIKEKILKQTINSQGYNVLHLTINGKRTFYQVHRLVKLVFDKDNEKETVNHIDEIKTNNNLTNLEWLSKSDNIKYSKNKPLLQFDLSGNFIREYGGTIETKSYGFNPNAVRQCCNGTIKTSGGYKWKYK